MNKIITFLAAALLFVPGMGAQKRTHQASGTVPTTVRYQAQAPAQARVTSDILPFGAGSRARIYDADVVAKHYMSTPPMRVLGDGTVIYGSMIYSSDPNQKYAGLYTFKADANPEPTLTIPFSESYEANGGGAYFNGKYYYNSYVYTTEMGYTFSTFLVYDFATKELTKTTHSFMEDTFDQTQITHDMTIDPTTGKIYAIAYTKEVIVEGIMEKYVPALSEIDDYTGFATPIGSTPGLIAIACNTAGQLYGVSKTAKGEESTLYRINKETAECTAIGPTGLNPEYVQSMTFDPVTDKLYWAETELNGTSGLYEVDITTGKASKIAAFANDEEFTGIFIMEPDLEEGAPAAVTDLHANFIDASLTGAIEFTVPALAHDGAAIGSGLTAEVYVDGDELESLDVAAGQKVSIPVTLTEGIHSATVRILSPKGEGPRVGMAWYVGLDAPAAVNNLKLETNADNQAVISWTAPTEGRNGGYLDTDAITYTVVRMPDEVKIAENVTETTVTDKTSFETAEVYYTVTPWVGTREGVSADTRTGVYGSGSELPVTFSFDTEEDFKLVTIYDANNDFDAQYVWGGWVYGPTFSWAYTEHNGCLVFAYGQEQADDWAIMPPFTAKAGNKYSVTFKVAVSSDPETLAVTAGSANSIEAQKVILPAAKYTNKYNSNDGTGYKDVTATFTAEADGNYYIGFHCTSAKKAGYLYIDDVTVDDVPNDGAPAAVESLTVTPGAEGALTATIAFNAPAKTTGAAALTSISEINIYRGNNNTAIHTFTAPQPGAALQWEDTAPVQGFNTYRVVAYNADGAGEKALATEYVGFDFPTAPTEVSLEEYQGYPTIRWIAPETGINGGYVNPETLIYRIRRSDGSLVAARATGDSFVDKTLNPANQDWIYYQIEPVSEAGVGDYALTNYIWYGEPYKEDFYESFADAAISTNPWVMFRIKGSTNLWTTMSQGYYPTCFPADNDGGLLAFECTSGHNGDEGRIISPKISLKEMNIPIFSFVLYHNLDDDTAMGGDQFQDRMLPEIMLPDGTFVPLTEEPIYVDEPKYDYGWYMYRFNLSKFKEYDYIHLSFHGYASFQNDVYIDMVSIESNIDHDLMAYTFNAPANVKAGQPIGYRLTMFNQGMKAASDYTVKLVDGTTTIATVTDVPEVASGKLVTLDIEVPTTLSDEGKTFNVKAVIEWADDEEQGNNTTTAIATQVVSPDVPQVKTLAAELSGEKNVKLSWNEPNALHVNDSFEDYTAYSIEKIGDYKLIDGDKGLTYTLQGFEYPNGGDPMAFMVFDPWTLGISQMLPEWGAKTGKQMLAAFSACDDTGAAIDSDDWFISPEVHGATELKFFAKTANWEWGLETFEVLYSTTGNEVADFKALSGQITADKDWVEYTYNLPLDAKYFAIHYISNDGFIFYLDDLCYTRKMEHGDLVHTGFKVYRDGTAVAELGKDAREYIDTDLADGLHTYGVTAMFSNHESAPVEVKMQVGESGIEDAHTGITVEAANGVIFAQGTEEFACKVVNVAGMTLFEAADASSYQISVAPGVYMVVAGDQTYKVIVK